MRTTGWLRAAAVFLALFFLGHTAAVLLPGSSGPREDAVLQAMKGFHFDAMGRDRTIWDFWQGLNFLASVCLAILVALAWQLGALARRDAALAGPFAWALGIGLAAMAGICWGWFFLAPAAMATAAAACALAGAAAARRASPPA